MALTCHINTTVPPCPSRTGKKACRCASCVIDKCPERSDLLVSLAEERLAHIQRGTDINANSEGARHKLLTARMKKALPLDSDFEDYKEEVEGPPTPLSEGQLKSLVEDPYQKEVRGLMRSTVRHLVQNHSEECLTPLSVTDDRLVQLMEVQGSPCVVKKTVVSPSEILIHEQLHSLTQNNEMWHQLIPTPYAARKVNDEHYEAYMEYVKGPTLAEAISNDLLDGETFMNALLVIHSFLAYVKRQLGFIHGDLTLNNIVLRGLGSNRHHNVPITTSPSQAEEGILVTLPFCPVIIDFGVSCTHAYSCMTDYLSPYSNEIVDLVRLYENVFVKGAEDGIISETHRHLSIVLGGNWHTSNYYPAPMPLFCDALTHESIIRRYLSHAVSC